MGQYPCKFGKYILLERVNVGGMAEVFKAKAFGVAGFERVMALKRILPSLVEDEEFIKMFIDEARIAVQLDHPNIVQIYELGKHGDHYYIAMEYLPSRDLRAILDKLRAAGQLMSIAQAAWVTQKTSEGLDYAHRRTDKNGDPLNIIHRDVSPQNVLLTFDGDTKVIDFGIAKAANRASKTQAGVLKGKFGYMSPEQVRGLPIDRRSDIFAVGVLLYEMLTGERLFIGESDFSTLERVRNAEVIPPTTFNKKISPELERVVLKSLAREPEDRYQWASELAEDLRPFCTSERTEGGRPEMAAFMGKLYAREIAKEKATEAEYMKLKLGDIVSPRKAVEYEEDDATSVNAPMPTADDPQPSVDDGIEYEEFEGEDKTFVLEASVAGQMLQDGGTDPNKSPPGDLDRNPDFLAEPSLYGEDDEDLYDDSATQVSVSNPFAEDDPAARPPSLVGNDALADIPEFSDEDKTYIPNMPSAPDESVEDPHAMQTQQELDGQPAPPLDPVAAAMQEDLQSMSGGQQVSPPLPAIAPAATPGVASQPPLTPSGGVPPVGQPTHAGPTPRPASSTGPVRAVQERAVEPPTRPAISKGMMGGLVGGAVLSFLMLIGVAVLVIVRLLGTPSDVKVVMTPATPPPAGLAVYVDGQPVTETLPAQFQVTPDAAHQVRVTAPGHQPLELNFAVPAGTTLPLQVQLVKAQAPKSAGAKTDGAKSDGVENAGSPAAADTWRLALTTISGGASIHGAEVYLQGRLLGVTPFEHEFSRGTGGVDLEFRANGFATKQVAVKCGPGCREVGPLSVKLMRSTGPADATQAPTDTEPKDAAVDKTKTETETETEATAKVEPETAPKKDEPTIVAAVAKTPEKSPKKTKVESASPKKRTPKTTKPKAKSKKRIPVEIGTRPYAKLYIDGSRRAHSTPLMADRAVHLPVGPHRLRFVDESGKQYRYRINIKKDADRARLVVILGKAVRRQENLTVKAH